MAGDLLSDNDVGVLPVGVGKRRDQGLVAGDVGEDSKLLRGVVSLNDLLTLWRPDKGRSRARGPDPSGYSVGPDSSRPTGRSPGRKPSRSGRDGLPHSGRRASVNVSKVVGLVSLLLRERLS